MYVMVVVITLTLPYLTSGSTQPPQAVSVTPGFSTLANCEGAGNWLASTMPTGTVAYSCRPQ
jgi:hypothetical protein